MKSIGNILGILSFIGVCILGFLHFNGKNQVRQARKPRPVITADSTGKKGEATVAEAPTGVNIGYVNLDTLEEKYAAFKKKKAEFESRDKSIGESLEKEAMALQREYEALVQKAQQGQIDQASAQAQEQKLLSRQQDLEKRRQNQGTALLNDQEKFNKDLQDNLKGFLEDFSAENGYDYIMMHSAGSSLLYANPELDVTKEVLEALNSGKNFKKSNAAKKEEKK